MSGKLRIAVAGLGWVALHRHIPSIRRNPDLELVGVIDRHDGLAQRVAGELGLSLFAQTDNLSNVSWLDQVDALTIGAPPSAHAPLVIAALERGKHVLTEKPFAMSLQEGQAMTAAAQKAGKTLAVVHNFQFSRAAMRLKRDLASGRLGKITRIAATQWGNPQRRLPSWYETLPLGLFYDESPHFFYLLSGLCEGNMRLEKAHAVSGEAGTNTPRLVHLLYRGADGVPVTIDCQFDSAVSEWFVRVSGEKETALIDIFRDIYIRLPNDKTHGALDILRTSASALSQHVIQHIPNGLALLRGRLDYGNDEIMRRFALSARTGREDEKIGMTQALYVLEKQHEATASLKESLTP